MNARPFHRDLETLIAQVVDMSQLSRRSVHEGVQAFLDLDRDRARLVVLLNREINHLDVEIEARALHLIALHQPVAVDLRTLGACLKIITYLDRIGRYGFDCAKAALLLDRDRHPASLATIGIMREKALNLLDTAMQAFRSRDAALAQRVEPADDEVDALYETVVRECVAHMVQDSGTTSDWVQHVLVARHLERVGDNATKIAEKTTYMCTGRNRLDALGGVSSARLGTAKSPRP